jgi:carbohydrate binding protein with CBM6 domain/phospholipase D-like protein
MGTRVISLFGHSARRIALALAAIAVLAPVTSARAQDRIMFAALENIKDEIIAKIQAENVRIDISAWYLTEHEITVNIVNRKLAGVPVRVIGDRGSIFEIDPNTRREFEYLATNGVPIRLRENPTWFPEIDHWKAGIFVGQGIVEFGSANWTPFELAPASSTNFKDETALFTSDPALVNAFKTKFDQYWADTTYFMDWNQAYRNETGTDFPVQLTIDRTRLEPDYAMPPDMYWGQGPEFNDPLIAAINAENNLIYLVAYRLTVDNITNALLAKKQAGKTVRVFVEPNEYRNAKWPEFWMTAANMDKLWANGVSLKQRAHMGLTHMKTLVTSTVVTNASSNFAANWQRDHNYFIRATVKPAIYQAIRDRVAAMWNDTVNFTDFTPLPPNTPTLLAPASGAGSQPTTPTLEWNRTPFATSYDVYLGTAPSALSFAARVPAQIVQDPPTTYSWTATAPLAGATTYYWKVVARTNATDVQPTLVASSSVWSFTTSGGTPPPAPGTPTNPSPANGATGVGTNATLSWSATSATSYDVYFGTASNPPLVASNVASPSYTPALTASTTYFWKIVARNSSGTTTGPVWSFATAAAPPPPPPNVFPVPGTIQAEDFEGGQNVGYFDTTAGNSGGQYRATDVDIEATSDAGGGYNVGWMSATEWLKYTINVAAAGTYTLQARVACSGAGGTFHVEVNGRDVTGPLSVPNTGGWQNWITLSPSVSLSAGQQPMRVVLDTAGPGGAVGNLNWITFSSAAPPPPPGTPSNPSPASGATGVSTTTTLSWSAATGATSYDVYFGTASNPPLAASNVTTTTYTPALAASTTYFWKIVARNSAGTTSGPVWSFSTAASPPPPPGTPSSPSPASGATGVASNATLSWSASGATSYDVYFGTAANPPLVASNITSASYTPTMSASTTYQWKIVARNSSGTTTGPIWSFTTAAAAQSDIVIYAGDVPAANVHGNFLLVPDSSAAGGSKLSSNDGGFATTGSPIANPADYFEVRFDAPAGVPYTLWLRLRATGDSKWNDSMWAQFSDARINGAAAYPIGTTSGLLINLENCSGCGTAAWGWINSSWWLAQPATVTFATSGPHTLRLQIREDGVALDQIVLSPSRYLTVPPGPVRNDPTIVGKQ